MDTTAVQTRSSATLARIMHCLRNLQTVPTIDLYKAKEDANWYGAFAHAGTFRKEISRRDALVARRQQQQQAKPKPVMAGV